jgi:hypothetical protein
MDSIHSSKKSWVNPFTGLTREEQLFLNIMASKRIEDMETLNQCAYSSDEHKKTENLGMKKASDCSEAQTSLSTRENTRY